MLDGSERSAPWEGTGFRYGVQRPWQVDVLADGQVLEQDGERIWRVSLRSPDAVMLSVQFDRFDLPEEGRVYLYDLARTRYLGAFSRANAAGRGLATAVLPGDAVTIEYRGPAGGDLRVGSITHAWTDLFRTEAGRDIDPGYQSASCHTNVICPEAAAWQQQKRSVAMFLRPDGGACSGVLMNNTAQNGIPYFMAAKHCYQPNEDQWVFYFNYDSPTCIGNAGPSGQTLTGAAVAAARDAGDLLLLRLHDVPPASYDVYYAGWSRSTLPPTSGAMIHHPLSDVKKINFFQTTALASTPVPQVECWRTYWTNGVTEGGSSGAPLFDQNKRVVGLAFDGSQTCATSTTMPTDHAKLVQNWDGTGPSVRLRDWLDPANTVTTLNGYDPVGTPVPVYGLRLGMRIMLEGPFVAATGSMRTTLRENGLLPLTEPYTQAGYAHHGGGGGETTSAAQLAITGSNAIVDWVVLEVRSAVSPATVVATRSALLRASGVVVDVDGSTTVSFPHLAWGNYHVAVRHRNHLGVITAMPHVLGGVDWSRNVMNGSLPLMGSTTAIKNIGGTRCLWAGDVNGDGQLKYTGAGNDRDPILSRVGGAMPTTSITGYHREDVNLDGVVRYTGLNNDRDPILVNLGGAVPTVTRQDLVP